MTVTTNIALFIAVLAIFVVVGKSQSYDVLCSNIKGTKCIVDKDCKCSGARLICNRVKKCSQATWKDFLSRQKCRGVFKGSCKTNSDCYCNEIRLECEANECVREKLAVTAR